MLDLRGGVYTYAKHEDGASGSMRGNHSLLSLPSFYIKVSTEHPRIRVMTVKEPQFHAPNAFCVAPMSKYATHSRLFAEARLSSN